MSDYFRNQPGTNPQHNQRDAGNDAWGSPAYPAGQIDASNVYSGAQGSPVGGYDEGGIADNGADLYAAWRRPGTSDFLDDEPTPFGAEMQQGGVPLYNAEQLSGGFRAMGDDAPTKIAPAVQRVSRRVTVAEEGMNAPVSATPRNSGAGRYTPPAAATDAPPAAVAPSEEAPPRRRRSRMDRPRTAETQQPAAPSLPSSYDPFSAGDSEVSAKPSRMDAGSTARPAAMQGGRYNNEQMETPSGSVAAKAQAVRDSLKERQMNGGDLRQPAFSAYPDDGDYRPRPAGAPVRRPMPQEYSEDGNRPMQRPAAPQGGAPVRRPMPQEYTEDGNRPMQRPAAPQGGAPVRRPMPQEARNPSSRRPVPEASNRQPQAGGAYPRNQQPLSGDQSPYAYRAQQGRPAYDDDAPSQRSSFQRKPYDFERENDSEPRRKGNALVPIVIVLLVLGALLAGLCLPDWANMGGKVGETVLPVKNAVVSAFSSVKNMILPEEEPIKSFTVSASGDTAPVSVRFTVQTSKNIAGLRVEDDQGKTLYSQAYTDQLILTNEVVENSNALIWQLVCTVDTEYTGGFTAYTAKKDGTESAGFRAANTVEIAAPKPALPPVQSFTIDTESSAVPVDVIFAVVTSAEVDAVRVVDQYKSPVASMSVTDQDDDLGTMMENGDVRTWTLNAEITAAYSGSYAVQYRTAADALNFTDSDYSVKAQFTGEEDTDLTGGDALTDDNGSNGNASALAPVSLATPQPTEKAPSTTAAAVAPTQAATKAPTPAPTPEPTAAPTLAPDSTSLPILNAQADASANPASDELKTKAVVYSNGKSVQSFNRTSAISMLSPFTTYAGGSDYAIWKQAGVLTFRSGPMRQNAAYGTVTVENQKLTVEWNNPVGSMKVSDGTLYGVNAPGQPLIVKWPTEVRQRMSILEEARGVTALKEVIVAGQDGKVYFYNLSDGTASREPISIGAPSAGGLSVATNGTPILGVGQSHSKLSGKVVKSGYHLINLLNNKEEMLVQTDGDEINSNYKGVMGAALFDSKTGTMIFGSQGGVLYTAELGKQTEAYDFQAGKISLSTSLQAYKATVKGQDKKNTNIDASVAMYNNYVYYGDQYGIVQCVNVNDMTTVWAVNTGDNVDATPALDMDDDSTVALYTGNTILLKRKQGVCTLRRLNALTGEEDWRYEVPDVVYNNEYEIGLEASPVVGQENISDLVIFTVTNGKSGSKAIALNKKSGSVEWQTDFSVETVSSPLAVYDEAGDAWIVQALGDGQINLMDGRTGEVLDTLKLDAPIKGSPAAYGNLLVIGTTGKETGGVYCIKID